MQKIKTFPLRFIDNYLEEIGKCAEYKGISKEEFMRIAINEKVVEVKKEIGK
ncbi:hypothetical protein [Clostridium botulinum]|uniref:hypothetical protein n=1 Tax=Clostridium botulinum TaxID=1491 RepID=UPI000310FEE7|nr:hypothetical protein [Clostridium botulinum]MBY6850363.1 hypothetical protein [Clostridium botulinum]MBY6857423.1 hypothetical protein [Clostridium botulinum]MBY6967393.1 hypothetical protein [Clostridium botulinum]HBJ1686157.1 hypothetical protein [Clostridium botulinum]